ncbi:MAG: helix-turn-helix domain-containing protein [Rhodanobacter sp.]
MNAPISTRRRKVFVCPVDVTLSMISGKWKPMILWLLTAGPRRFSDLQSAMPLVAHKVLAQQLRQLVSDDVIRRVVRENMPSAGGYQLTAFGRTLRPALNALANWGKTHHQSIGAHYDVNGDDL